MLSMLSCFVIFSESNTTFRMLLNEATRRLKGLAARLGNSVEKARPYHEAAEAAAQARTACQRAAVQYQRASEIHAAAKETVALAEQRFKSKQNEWQFDNAWQEMLNHATIKVMDAEHQKAESGREHMKRAQLFNAAEHKMQQLEDHLRKSIIKSRPYFEEKQLCQEQLNTQKERIQQLQEEVQKVKERYAKSLRALEAISEEIHRKRRDLYGDSEECPVGPREPGVGAEKDSVNDFHEEERHDFDSRKSRDGTPESNKEDTHGLEELRRRVRKLAARPLEGGQPPEDSWEQELNTTVQKLDQMLLAREQQAREREKERKAQSMHSSYDKLSDLQHFETMTRSQSYFDNSAVSKSSNQIDFKPLKDSSISKPNNAQLSMSSESDGELKSVKDVRDSKSDGSPCKSIDSSRSNLATSKTQLCLSVTNLQDLLQPGTPHHFIPNATYEMPSAVDKVDRYYEELAGKPEVFPHDAMYEMKDSTNTNNEDVVLENIESTKTNNQVEVDKTSSSITSSFKDNTSIKTNDENVVSTAHSVTSENVADENATAVGLNEEN